MTQGNSKNLKKRGKKGGTQFPRYSLKHLSQFLENILGKTHTSTITIEQLNAGVFGVSASSPTGKVKCSALKQFGLLSGDYKKLDSTDLCSALAMSDGNEQITNYQKALKNVSVFADALKTFQNSSAEKSKIAQYAVSTLKVHPDMKDDFVKVFVESCEIAGLSSTDGNSVTFLQNPSLTLEESASEIENENLEESENNNQGKEENKIPEIDPSNSGTHNFNTQKQGKSNINVNIDVDPSMDPEKLEKLLKLLKGYGAI